MVNEKHLISVHVVSIVVRGVTFCHCGSDLNIIWCLQKCAFQDIIPMLLIWSGSVFSLPHPDTPSYQMLTLAESEAMVLSLYS